MPPAISGSITSTSTITGAVAPYRIFPATSGPSSPVSYSGNFIAGVSFTTIAPGTWFSGFWWWVCSTGQSTSPVKCALWSTSGITTGLVVPGTVVTSGTLTAGQWNYIPIATPVELSLFDTFCAAVGVNGNFPDTNNYWGSGQPGANGITNGPLVAFSSPSGSYQNFWTGGGGVPQGVFTTGGTDPSVTLPSTASGTDNFWVDVQLVNTPSAFAGPYRLWPNRAVGDPYTQGDAAVDYNIGTEIRVTATCTVGKIWVYVPAGSSTLATEADIWSISTGGITGTLVASNTSPTWLNPDGSTASASAGGWMYCTIGTPTLTPGNYRISTYNANGTTGAWGAKRLGYWGTSATSQGAPNNIPASVQWGLNGIVSGPIYAPPTPLASTCYIWTSPNGNTTTEPGQSVFWQGPPNSYPNQYVDALYQNYWVDMEVSPTATSIALAGSITSASSLSATFSTQIFGGWSSTSALTATLTTIGGLTSTTVSQSSLSATLTTAVSLRANPVSLSTLTGGVASPPGLTGTIASISYLSAHFTALGHPSHVTVADRILSSVTERDAIRSTVTVKDSL